MSTAAPAIIISQKPKAGTKCEKGDKVTVVSGGSVSGSLPELIMDIRFSKEQKQHDNKLGPAVIKIADVTIAGSEQ